ncbi:MAG: pantoate--beta-alanine ligase [Pirellulaceae bacterium]|jgi:pantoate--beta-alanine ligase|nr:pantoate--beta-alanine ligase [Pirellulaceae bacterium]MDP6717245.1 pantoate--beta-alanine ligase [Pirellulaceae bacterium]
MATDASHPIPRLIRTVDELRAVVASERQLGNRIGLVPTMGALHEGHLSLAKISNQECDTTIVTIFINPQQFAPHEDLDKYPRTIERDLDLLAKLHVPFVFAPTEDQIYPPGFSTFVDPPSVALPMEGESRPHHFRGVATVVLKLFHLAPADAAYFGQKDYQQSLVIRRMVEDLGLLITIRICPIIRERDGLAMSSRNRYLSPEERVQALAISRALDTGRLLVEAGERDVDRLRNTLRSVLGQAGISQIDYVQVVHPETLDELDQIGDAAIALIAAHVGKTRLIDNCLFK